MRYQVRILYIIISMCMYHAILGLPRTQEIPHEVVSQRK